MYDSGYPYCVYKRQKCMHRGFNGLEALPRIDRLNRFNLIPDISLPATRLNLFAVSRKNDSDRFSILEYPIPCPYLLKRVPPR